MQHIQVVTGKGGVGKSFSAALLAQQLALEGKRTLLVEMVPESYLARILDFKIQGDVFQPQKTRYGFEWAIWTGESCLSDYVQYWIKVPWVSKAFLGNSWLKSLVQMAPGLREISFLGKLTSQVRKHGPAMNYDHIVVDAVSTGHFLSLLRAPKSLAQVVNSGPMKVQSESILAVMNDPRVFHTRIVTNLESFSVREAQELLAEQRKIVQSEISLIANKMYDGPQKLDFTVNTDAEKKFLGSLKDLRAFQKENINELKKQHLKIEEVLFYREPLAVLLGQQNEVRKIFANS